MENIVEYRVMDTTSTGLPVEGGGAMFYVARLQLGLNELGGNGWDLCGIVNEVLIFKREAMDTSPPA